MKIAASSDWRNELAFDTPVIVAELIPGDPTRCSVCGGDSAVRPRTELWVVKHRHPKHHDGHVRFYCGEHLPVVEKQHAPSIVRAGRTPPRSERPAPRRSPVVEKSPAVCPDCFVEIPPTGVCGVCGRPAD